jgi:gamma-glutamylcyclotransferase (GGCT)/AIG2-like uncharacterized protein YtfP
MIGRRNPRCQRFGAAACSSWSYRDQLLYLAIMHVFTYGTLMFPEVWQAVVGRQFKSMEATAPGFAIYRVVDAVFPGIVKAGDDDAVQGVVYLDVDDASVARLDTFEDTFYERQALWLRCADGQTLAAETYVVPPQNRRVLTDEVWRREEFIASGGLQRFTSGFQGFDRIGRML